MFALVLFICYLDGGCEDIVVDVYDNERQCTTPWTISGYATAAAFR
ncbi:secreted protein [Klebsiella michiganensis]|nr:secreted protein [Klebsiella michiganensis]